MRQSLRGQPTTSAYGPDHRRRFPRAFVFSLGAVMLVGVLAACGDDEPSSEAAFCEAGDALRADIAGLGDVDVLAEGTSAFDDPIASIRADLENLKTSGSDVAADEIAELDTAVAELGTALDGLGADVSIAAAQAVGDSAGAVVGAANTVLEKVTTTCP